MSKPEIVWVDIETTGLDRQVDRILEIGIRVTDADLVTLYERVDKVYTLAGMDRLKTCAPHVREMHDKSGLTSELIVLSEAYGSPAEAERHHGLAPVSRRLHSWLTDQLKLPSGEFPMAGSTIQFDRKFIEYQMPVVDGFFSHRHIDVSSIRELAKVYNPRVYENRPQGETWHRPLSDITDSIEQLGYFLDEFLMVG